MCCRFAGGSWGLWLGCRDLNRCWFSRTQVLEFHLQLLDPSPHDHNLLHRGRRLLGCILRLLDESLDGVDSIGECLLASPEIIDRHGLQLAGSIEPVIHAIDALGDGVDGFQVCS
ncbi:hypothetical protein ALQ30_200760 [Pseudomonas syringae pv. persicae]|uniref:Uncharacterized protein n=1 Tax=Pseudomonas syringae pv. persicae TaxID=237306 RepID=A0A3M4B2A9_9PSED|nr:hypothetical protein ALQ30_200760 [Pseudomonas syringae pv. persicae]